MFATGATETEISDELIELLLEKQIFVVPTIFSIFAHENPNGSMPLVYDKLITQVSRLFKAGVNIGVGTDGSIPFVPIGVSLHEELAQLAKCGLSPVEVITAATSGNARLLRMQDRVGSVSPGYFADLVVVDGDPTVDIRNTRNVRLVISSGRIVVDNM
jgi:imidazolonepropionase-like amidohydrolase